MLTVMSLVSGEVLWVEGKSGPALAATLSAFQGFELSRVCLLRDDPTKEISWAARIPDLYVLVGNTVAQPTLTSLRVRAPEMLIYVVESAAATKRHEEALLNAGADGCSFLPVLSSTLSARLRALLRRRPGTSNRSPPRAGSRADGSRAAELPEGQCFSFSPSEQRLLKFLACREGTWVSRQEIMHEVFHVLPRYDSSLLRTHVWNLRRKLGSSRWLLRTDRAKGLMLSDARPLASELTDYAGRPFLASAAGD